MKNTWHLSVVLFLFLLGRHAIATDTVLVTHQTSSKDFKHITHQYLDILPDAEGQWTFDVVRTKTFRPLEAKEISSNGEFLFSKNKACVWIRFTIQGTSKNNHWLLEFLDFNIKDIKLYLPDEKGIYTEFQSGYAYPFSSREIIHKNLDFSITLSEEPQVIYARIEPGSSTVLSAEIKSYEGFIQYSLTEYMLLGLFYGIMLVMIIYNLILYFTVKENYYAYYVFYALCVALASMCHDGIGFQYVWPTHPNWNKSIQLFAHFGLVLWTLLYSKWFLNTKNNSPKIDLVIRVMIVLTMVLLAGILIFKPAQLGYLIVAATVPFLIVYGVAIKIYRNGFKPARFFLMAFSFFFIGFVIRILTYFGIIDNSIVAVYSYNIGVVLEMILFSVAIGDKIKTIKEEREMALVEKDAIQQKIIEQLHENEKLRTKVNRELEDKVRERTEEVELKNKALHDANAKLKELTEQANQWNIKLDLDNRQLQTEIKEIEKARILLKDVRFDEFSSVFPDERSCLQYLAELKWKDGYHCKKCDNTTFGKSKTPFGRRCTKCNYDESPTTDTLFHRLRFPITKAFYMVYLVSIKDNSLTVDELSEILSLRRETCWSFRKKILESRKNSKTTRKGNEEDGWSALALISIQS
ncbi:MAG: chromosome partitioning protein ParA [Cytophagaceae bacterium]|jgi:hypothetical protein|nr:chromosome partitioning protein ParA [Cytophagaceae bacterium]